MFNLRNQFIGSHKIFWGKMFTLLINEGETQTLSPCLFSLTVAYIPFMFLSAVPVLFSIGLLQPKSDAFPAKFSKLAK